MDRPIRSLAFIAACFISLVAGSVASGQTALELWVEMGTGSATGGGITDNEGGSFDAVAAVDLNGYPIICWRDHSSGSARLYVTRWNGSTWVSMDGLSPYDTVSDQAVGWYAHAIATDSQGRPIVCWEAPGYEVYVKCWNGSSWELRGNVSQNSGISSRPEIAVASDDNPIVCWYDNSNGNFEIYVKRWNGSAWVEMGVGSASGGGISQTATRSSTPVIATDVSNRPVVAWEEYTAGNWASIEVYVRRWNPDTEGWDEMGLHSASGGGISDSAGASGYPVIAFDGAGMPVVSWADHTTSCYEIYLKRWDGDSWEPLGDSASGGGISNSGVNSEVPSIAMGWDGNPIVTWPDKLSSTPVVKRQIYVRRWNGSQWVEMGTESASNLGISAEVEGQSNYPAIVVDAAGYPIVFWHGSSGEDTEIYVKKFEAEAGPPVAEAGGPYVEQATSWDGADVLLDGTDSYDPDNLADPDAIVSYSWDLDLSVDSDLDGDPANDVDATGSTPTAPFAIGQTDISLIVEDADGLWSEPGTSTVTVTTIDVPLDIKPGSDPNSINLGSHGVVPVAFLTTPGFDASTINPSTVTLRGEDFSDGLVKLRGKKQVPMANLEDVDDDGDLDLVVHLETENLALEPTAMVCTLGALTYDGYVLEASDFVNIVPAQ